ncbi:Metalloendopeptidase OMA1, mitochondrial [Vanrija pseudolonga]|uniref:Metalloendopeptidase OMA1, mitochondrial n=1 Tax=Vanrija pseudolonga TaxID=143232 RepID=A0AAF0Y6W7_9TREE|nr:Metalloendopeptidase OMA1, mitochondrial [Vanrija pseudolonga]
MRPPSGVRAWWLNAARGPTAAAAPRRPTGVTGPVRTLAGLPPRPPPSPSPLIRPATRITTRAVTATTPRVPPSSLLQSAILLRALHTSKPRRDVFFLSIPAIKSGLLNVTRFSLLFLPFVFRYKLWKKYKRTAWILIQVPIFAFCIVLALGLNQDPRTGRWRLLLMGEREELAWSHRKHKEVLMHEGPLLLPPDDPRSRQVERVTARIITALEEQDKHIVSGAAWPPKEDFARSMNEREERFGDYSGRMARFEPSATAHSAYMPFRPQSQNPLKNMESADWNIYIIDHLNAFALPSKDLFIYTGLLDTLPKDDTMLAAVLSHEIAHVAQRHAVENLGFLNVAAVAFDVLRGISFALTISFPFITDSAGMFINWLNDVVAQRAYSRKLEEEADAVGLELMAIAGYDPRAMLDLWGLMACVEEDAQRMGQSVSIENRLQLLRTHPTSQARQEAIQHLLPKTMKVWESRRSTTRAAIERLKAAERKQAAEEAVALATVATVAAEVKAVEALEEEEAAVAVAAAEPERI